MTNSTKTMHKKLVTERVESVVFPAKIAKKPIINRKIGRKMPKNYDERSEMLVRDLRVPATWEQFLLFDASCDFRVQFRNEQIISFLEIDEKTNTIMGEATVLHEILVARLITEISIFLAKKDLDFDVLGSNSKIFIDQNRRGFNPDLMVILGEPIEKTYNFSKKTMKGISNPWLVVEVLSPSTRDFDLNEKLADYREIPSLQQIIFVEQGMIQASTHIRTGENEWKYLEFSQLSDALPILDGTISLEKIYKKVF